jgi:hypothetical protein
LLGIGDPLGQLAPLDIGQLSLARFGLPEELQGPVVFTHGEEIEAVAEQGSRSARGRHRAGSRVGGLVRRRIAWRRLLSQ